MSMLLGLPSCPVLQDSMRLNPSIRAGGKRTVNSRDGGASLYRKNVSHRDNSVHVRSENRMVSTNFMVAAEVFLPKIRSLDATWLHSTEVDALLRITRCLASCPVFRGKTIDN